MRNIFWIPFLFRWLFDNDVRKSFERLTWSRKELSEFKFKKLKEIVEYAYNNVPFYKEHFENNGFHPKMLKDENDSYLIPILTKDKFKTALMQKTIFSKEKRKWKIVKTHTTGSTGVPTTLYFDQFARKARNINTLRAFFLNGVFPDKKFLLLWRRKKLGKVETLKSLLGIFRYIPVVDVMNVNTSALSENKILELLNDIKRFSPDIIRGYVSALWVLAKYKQKFNIDILPEKIIASAEYLPYAVWDELEQIFKCPVINYYGGTEAAPIACSLPNSRSLVVFEDFYYVNIVDNYGKECKVGENGRILITDYYNLYMPLIKYEIGDIAEWNNEYIGPFKTFKEVKGRINDVFILPGNKLLFSHNWHIYFRDVEGLKCFKVIQERIDYIKVILYPLDEEILIKNLENIKSKIQDSLGKDVRIDWVIEKNLSLDKGDKFRAVQTKLDWREYI